MITLPTRAILIPTHTTPAVEDLPEKQYFDIVYYFDTGHSTQFHSMTTTIPLEELEPHIEQMDVLTVAMELHVPKQGDKKEIAGVRKLSQQAYQSISAMRSNMERGSDDNEFTGIGSILNSR